jgi:hypothetical protein
VPESAAQKNSAAIACQIAMMMLDTPEKVVWQISFCYDSIDNLTRHGKHAGG